MTTSTTPETLIRMARDWQAIAQREGSESLGTPEGAARLAEAKRYGMLADALAALASTAAPEPTNEAKALDFLAGLHPGLTVDDPMEMAQRIFDHVMAERAEWEREKANLVSNIELRDRVYRTARAAPVAAQQVVPVGLRAHFDKLEFEVGIGKISAMALFTKMRDLCNAYAAPPAPAARDGARLPLGDAQVLQLFNDMQGANAQAESADQMFAIIVRAIEKAHGIGGTTEGGQ